MNTEKGDAPGGGTLPAGKIAVREAPGVGASVGSQGPQLESTLPPAGDLVSEVAGTTARTVEEQLQQAGLELMGSCEKMSGRGAGLLQHADLLEDFTTEEVDILGASMLLVRAQPGQVLIREGERGDWMMLVLSGTVDVTKSTEPGADDSQAKQGVSRLAVVKEGASVGEMSMLDQDLRYATCTAIDTVEAAVLSRMAIGRLIRQHPGVGAKLMVKITQLLAQRLRNTSNQLVKLLQKK